jgi:hypothetical protein
MKIKTILFPAIAIATSSFITLTSFSFAFMQTRDLSANMKSPSSEVSQDSRQIIAGRSCSRVLPQFICNFLWSIYEEAIS